MRTVPCFEIPTPISGLQLLMQFHWGLMLCQWNTADLLGQQSPGISTAAHCVTFRHREMKFVFFLIGPYVPENNWML